MAYRIPNQHPLDLNQRVAVGVSIPFSSPSVFNLTYTTTDQIKSNLINYILTNRGERVLNPNFGSNLRAQLFENIDPDTISALEMTIISDIRRYFPMISINSLTLTPSYEEYAIRLVLTYSVLNNVPETIQILL